MSEQVPGSFKAFRIRNDDDGYQAGIESISLEDLSEGDVVIKVHFSGINFKDALAGTGKGKILRRFPLNGGIDAAGTVTRQGNSAALAEAITNFAKSARLRSEWQDGCRRQRDAMLSWDEVTDKWEAVLRG